MPYNICNKQSRSSELNLEILVHNNMKHVYEYFIIRWFYTVFRDPNGVIGQTKHEDRELDDMASLVFYTIPGKSAVQL